METETKTTLNRSVARAALQLKFTLELEVTSEDGDITKSTSQLLWRFNPNTVAAEFAPDWERLTQHPVVYCSAHREPISGKGRLQSVDLSNVKTFVAAFDKDRGSFVSAYRKENDIILQWTANLNAAFELNFLSEQDAAAVQSRFDAFVASYGRAIKAFAEEGLSYSWNEQEQAYRALLDELYDQAKGDKSRELLLKPIVQIGSVAVLGGRRPAVIVAPWHPLRLTAMYVKARR